MGKFFTPQYVPQLVQELNRLERRIPKEPCMLHGETTGVKDCWCSQCVVAKASVALQEALAEKAFDDKGS